MRGGKREGSGRKPVSLNAKPRCIRCNGEEYEKIKELLQSLRMKGGKDEN